MKNFDYTANVPEINPKKTKIEFNILRTLKCAVSLINSSWAGGGGAKRWGAGQINNRKLKFADFFFFKKGGFED